MTHDVAAFWEKLRAAPEGSLLDADRWQEALGDLVKRHSEAAARVAYQEGYDEARKQSKAEIRDESRRKKSAEEMVRQLRSQLKEVAKERDLLKDHVRSTGK